VPHVCVLVSAGQSLPPHAGIIVTVRDCTCEPPPHVTLPATRINTETSREQASYVQGP
jgi:hypothetical protein